MGCSICTPLLTMADFGGFGLFLFFKKTNNIWMEVNSQLLISFNSQVVISFFKGYQHKLNGFENQPFLGRRVQIKKGTSPSMVKLENIG